MPNVDEIKRQILERIPPSIDTFEKYQTWCAQMQATFCPPLTVEEFNNMISQTWQKLHPGN